MRPATVATTRSPYQRLTTQNVVMPVARKTTERRTATVRGALPVTSTTSPRRLSSDTWRGKPSPEGDQGLRTALQCAFCWALATRSSTSVPAGSWPPKRRRRQSQTAATTRNAGPAAGARTRLTRARVMLAAPERIARPVTRGAGSGRDSATSSHLAVEPERRVDEVRHQELRAHELVARRSVGRRLHVVREERLELCGRRLHVAVRHDDTGGSVDQRRERDAIGRDHGTRPAPRLDDCARQTLVERGNE